MTQIQKWKTLSEEDISPSKWFKLSKEKVKLTNGKETDYYVQKLDDVVMVFTVNNKNEVIFVRQYKHGVREITIELPAGRIEENNNPEIEAERELLEETGYKANKLEFIGKIITEPSKSSVRVYCYFSKSISLISEQRFDENEEIEVLSIPISEINKWVMDGKITASDTLAVIKIVETKFPELFQETK